MRAVLRHHHHPASVAERIDALMVAVLEPDDRRRLELLSQHLAPDFVYITRTEVAEGASGLSEAFSRSRHDAWRRTSLRRTSDVDMHHAHFRFSWEGLEQGRVVRRGSAFGWVDAAGLLSRLVSFDDQLPAADDANRE
jgi:hypothetical protein